MNAIVEEDLERITATPLPWQRLSRSTVLITGASGFLPTYLVRTLLHLNERRQANIRVLALVRDEARARCSFAHSLSSSCLELVVQDVTAPYQGPHGIDFLIHAASPASPKVYSRDPVGTFEANVAGTRQMLTLARQDAVKSFLFVSSGEVYGQLRPEHIPTQEDMYGYVDPTDVRSCYAEGKRAGETLCICWHHQFGVPARIVRPFHTYGPGMKLDDGRVFADLVADVVADRPLVLHSDGSARRPFCYLADATVGFFTALLLGQPGEAYNVGMDSDCSIRELAEILCELFPGTGRRVVFTPRAGADPYLPSPIQRNCPDISKMRALGWAPRTSVREGFERTVRSIQEAPA